MADLHPRTFMRTGCAALIGLALALPTSPTWAANGPSFKCDRTAAGSIEALVCGDEALSTLDRRLASVYRQAREQARTQRPNLLPAEQRGWIKGRNDCWKADPVKDCVRSSYELRIAELQARYRLVPMRGPFRFLCDGGTGGEVIMSFFDTQPPTAVAERGDAVSLMFLSPAASGAKYEGRNELFWEHQGEAVVRWGYGAPEMRCRSIDPSVKPGRPG